MPLRYRHTPHQPHTQYHNKNIIIIIFFSPTPPGGGGGVVRCMIFTSPAVLEGGKKGGAWLP